MADALNDIMGGSSSEKGAVKVGRIFRSDPAFLNTSDGCQMYLKSKIKIYAVLFANDIRKRNFWNVSSRYTSICNRPPPISNQQIFAFEVEYTLIRDPGSVASPREE